MEKLQGHKSNPVEVNLHKVEAEKMEAANNRFLAEGLELALVERQADRHFTYEISAGKRNGHQGISYQAEVYRAEDKSVCGRCNCAAFGLCKHLSAAYYISRIMVTQRITISRVKARAATIATRPTAQELEAEIEREIARQRHQRAQLDRDNAELEAAA